MIDLEPYLETLRGKGFSLREPYSGFMSIVPSTAGTGLVIITREEWAVGVAEVDPDYAVAPIFRLRLAMRMTGHDAVDRVTQVLAKDRAMYDAALISPHLMLMANWLSGKDMAEEIARKGSHRPWLIEMTTSGSKSHSDGKPALPLEAATEELRTALTKGIFLLDPDAPGVDLLEQEIRGLPRRERWEDYPVAVGAMMSLRMSKHMKMNHPVIKRRQKRRDSVFA